MNNLHRELAPLSDAAWAQIEDEASRTLKRYLAARRVVDVIGPKGTAYAAVGTGHTRPIQAPGEGIRSLLRAAQPLVELRVPFTLTREAIDNVERGSAIRTGSRSRMPRRRSPSPRIAPCSKAMPRPGSPASAKTAATPPCRCPQISTTIPRRSPRR
jgi:hypothetical protein